ncbi:MAG: SusD/RagB family nutrient-binding outer membrane lipoprotein [Candidatus Cryptobacteroides sp.]
MKNILKLAGIAVLCLSLTACNDYFHKINFPYGGLTEEDLDRDNLRQGSMIPTMELYIVPLNTAGAFQHCESLVGDVWGRMLMCEPGGGENNFGGDFSWYSPAGDHWISNPFTNVMSFYQSYVSTWNFTGHDSANSVWALTRIMRVAVMHRLADMYGPIPYTAINPEDLDLYIPYDREEDAWKAMLKELDGAVEDLEACISAGSCADITNFDRIYQGDMNKWCKYANSLLLRLAVRISNAEPELAKSYITKALDRGVIESNEDNAVMHMRIGLMENITSHLYTMMSGAYNDTYAAADLTCYMNGYKDARRPAYFTPYTFTNSSGETETVYFGLRAGSGASDAQVESTCSRPNVSQYSDYPLLTAAEVSFLRAECALKGWADGDAGDLYENGVRLSFSQWGVSGADAYLADSESVPAAYKDYMNSESTENGPSDLTIAWNDGDDAEKKLQRIITQKYIALYPLGHETWCDYRRTGYPEFMPICSGKVSPQYAAMPVANRLKFSVDESRQNSANLETAKTYLGGADDYSTKLWWAK